MKKRSHDANQNLAELLHKTADYVCTYIHVKCFNEHSPQNYNIGPRYAEIKYTQGGYEHLEMAKTYYSHAVKLNPNNMRALYGLLQVSSDIKKYFGHVCKDD
jgi:hypothetical protein